MRSSGICRLLRAEKSGFVRMFCLLFLPGNGIIEVIQAERQTVLYFRRNEDAEGTDSGFWRAV